MESNLKEQIIELLKRKLELRKAHQKGITDGTFICDYNIIAEIEVIDAELELLREMDRQYPAMVMQYPSAEEYEALGTAIRDHLEKSPISILNNMRDKIGEFRSSETRENPQSEMKGILNPPIRENEPTQCQLHNCCTGRNKHEFPCITKDGFLVCLQNKACELPFQHEGRCKNRLGYLNGYEDKPDQQGGIGSRKGQFVKIETVSVKIPPTTNGSINNEDKPFVFFNCNKHRNCIRMLDHDGPCRDKGGINI